MPEARTQVFGFAESLFDFGGGREGKLRFGGVLQVNIGDGIVHSEIVVHKGVISDDVRLDIARLENGCEFSIHGIHKGEMWGLPQHAPRLRLLLDRTTNVASIYLAVGSEEEREERLLDQMNLNW